jgi:hypothetical protein
MFASIMADGFREALMENMPHKDGLECFMVPEVDFQTHAKKWKNDREIMATDLRELVRDLTVKFKYSLEHSHVEVTPRVEEVAVVVFDPETDRVVYIFSPRGWVG